nr:hypothetical protein [Prolixibacteraceae bacterium]
MKAAQFIVLFFLLLSLEGFSQEFSVHFQVEKQSMSTPMSEIEDAFFLTYYYTKPLNVQFDGTVLNMYYENGATFRKINVSEINREETYEDGKLIMHTIQ